MKNIILILFTLAIVSCKKNRNCNCKTTFHYPGGSELYESSAKSIDARVTEKQAKAICDREASAIEKTHNNWWTNNGNWPSNNVYAHTYCLLE